MPPRVNASRSLVLSTVSGICEEALLSVSVDGTYTVSPSMTAPDLPARLLFFAYCIILPEKLLNSTSSPLASRFQLQAAAVRRSGDNIFQLPVYFPDSLFRRGPPWYRDGVGVFPAVLVGKVEAERGVPHRSSRFGELCENRCSACCRRGCDECVRFRVRFHDRDPCR